MTEPLVQVEGLTVTFRDRMKILDHVDFHLQKGETLGIVGESGCGKSMTALAMMRLMPSPLIRVAGGSIRIAGEDVLTADGKRLREIRGSRIAMIFQDPMTCLNPLYTVGNQIIESIDKNRKVNRQQARDEAAELLKMVGIPDPVRHLNEYPHQLSGGKRQRVMIAMALAGNPDVLIADEPTTALDVTVQAQIFDVLKEMQERLGTAIMLITHDMGAIAEMADRVAVMYAGRIVEDGDVSDILMDSRHPYTQGLVACIPHLSNRVFEEWPILPVIPGTVPGLSERPAGCAFAPRCPLADRRCHERVPPFESAGSRGSACWKVAERAVV